MTKIGFIGTGIMGRSIVLHLLNAGYDVAVYSRTKSKTEELLAKGATWQETPQKVVEASQIIFSMVGYPTDVKEIYYGENGIFSAEVTGKILVDMTTSTPSLAQEIDQTAKVNGGVSLDAPVSGGDIGARNGTLTVMVGGESTAYQEVFPIFEKFSGTIALQGGPGAGQHTKMANQIMIAGTMIGMTELLVYANAAGLDPEKVISTVGGGSGANFSLSHYGPRVLQNDYSPGFFVKHFIKDLKIALEEANKMTIELPGTKLALELYENLANQGFSDAGTQALIKLWWPDGLPEN